EYLQLATLCEKLGDKVGAAAHRVAAKALAEPKSVPEATQVQLNKAHQRAKTIERKMEQVLFDESKLSSFFDIDFGGISSAFRLAD
ncbi:unnamed protein product, partial [Prorocentrum cordatum]